MAKTKEATAVAEVADAGPPRPRTPGELIAAAIDKGMDAAQLEKLTAWANGMVETEARRAFNRDMIACQSEMPSIVNDAANDNTKSRYPKYETLLRQAKPIWSKHGFAVTLIEATLSGDILHYVGDIMHREGHTKTIVGDIGLDGTGPKGGASSMNRPQATGSTRSYGMRYLVRDAFCLAFADEDDDAVDARNAKVNDDQLKELNELIKACGEAGEEVDIPALLNWLLIKRLEDLKMREFSKARRELQRKLREAQAKHPQE